MEVLEEVHLMSGAIAAVLVSVGYKSIRKLWLVEKHVGDRFVCSPWAIQFLKNLYFKRLHLNTRISWKRAWTHQCYWKEPLLAVMPPTLPMIKTLIVCTPSHDCKILNIFRYRYQSSVKSYFTLLLFRCVINPCFACVNYTQMRSWRIR